MVLTSLVPLLRNGNVMLRNPLDFSSHTRLVTSRDAKEESEKESGKESRKDPAKNSGKESRRNRKKKGKINMNKFYIVRLNIFSLPPVIIIISMCL